MNVLIASVVLAAAISMVSSHPDKYSDKYDNIDVDSILNNDRVLKSYINCILDLGPCTQIGQDFKKHFPEAISTKCKKCTEEQKKIIRKTARHLMEKKKPEWEQIKKKYDPNNEQYDNFLKFMNMS